MKDIKVLTVRSEIAAGTRGAGMGIDALIVASLGQHSSFFNENTIQNIDDVNNILFKNNNFLNAKHIDGVLTMLKRVSNNTYDTLAGGQTPIVLAGDHSTAAGTISGIKQAYPNQRLGVIWIDAHADFHSPYTTPSGNMHGMPLSMVTYVDNTEEGVNSPNQETIEYWEEIKKVGTKEAKVKPEDIVFIGVRDTEGPEDVILDKFGIRNISVDEVRKNGPEVMANDALNILKECDMIYISFDVDSMDPTISKGTGTPVANGLTVEEALAINKTLVADEKVICWEMVEVNPTLDQNNIMANNAFKILNETVKSLKGKSISLVG
ncbi:arginase [Flammeovirga kamogawensis]|uniref:Arginase n=1 Tax=Flammeovirga kamogawensis TaxID=373891 RepID=A0ABX8GW42_9BACT|nr:arginase [Flammeovirga kamogawensis]MBB6460959.1 arginase [Flammeovirga kamogawensis]QWG07532.1 arginase [Flammeovirga kamogawensis]TRX69344.1 arginase [Flammeovirga kamogawensis]